MKQRQRPFNKQLLLQILTILALVALLVAILFSEISRTAGAVSRERVRMATYTYTDTLCGYLFRNETALRSNNNGPVRYHVENGTAVSLGATVAEVYLDDTGSDKRERAAELSAQIRRYDAALQTLATDWKKEYLDSYASLMRELSDGDLVAAKAPAEYTATALALRDAENEQTAAEMRAARDALLEEWMGLVQFVDAPQLIPATQEGLFYRESDGLEALFGKHAASALTPEGLNALLASPANTEGVVGKLISTGPFALALPTDAETAAAYTVGERYTLHFGNGITDTLTLAEITYSADAQSALLLMHGEQMPKGLSPMRRQSVRVERDCVSGLSLPAAALRDGNIVFIDDNGVARALQISPILTEDGCVLVAPGGALCEDMRVIISTRRVYDGKVLN